MSARVLHSSLSPSFHDAFADRLRGMGLENGASHEAVPVSAAILETKIRTAVDDLLGGEASLIECRHVHVNSRPVAGFWHVDDYCGEPWPDGARFAILCYFPQDTTIAMGPTEARVGGRVVSGAGPAGTCLLMRQNVEHRSTANMTGRERFMVKYLFRCEVAP